MKKMKVWVSLGLCACILAFAAACGKKDAAQDEELTDEEAAALAEALAEAAEAEE